jgi:hypothetical protein
MITNNFTLLSNLDIRPEDVLEQSFQTGFCKRMGKIHPCTFWETFCLASIGGSLSYNDLAARIAAQGGVSVSRQAIGLKTSRTGQLFFQRVLAMAMATQFDAPAARELGERGGFRRIIVQDSTVIRLPARLYSEFSGVKNAHSTVCNARIQGVYDVLAGRFLQYSIDPYNRNDLSAATDFTPQAGDLVLKDRGYFKFEALCKDIQQGADWIFRYKHPTVFYNPRDEKRIDLARLLGKNGTIDQRVLMGSKKHERIEVRLVAFPVPEEVANLRRMKARKEFNGKNPSKDVLHLMGWTIFVTTISKQQASPRQIATLYGIRWRIENIFKTWKSNFCFDHIHNVSAPQLRMLLMARLTMIVLLHHCVFLPLATVLAQQGHELSLMKFMRYAQMNLSKVLRFPSKEYRVKNLVAPMIRYATIDRRKRKSLENSMALILQEINPRPLT